MPMRSDPVPTDLLHIRDAAALAGKSVDTVRRWRGAHGLRDYRDTRAPSSPSLFSRSDLMALIAGLSAPLDLAVIDGVLAGSAGGLPRPVTTSPGGHLCTSWLKTYARNGTVPRPSLKASAPAIRLLSMPWPSPVFKPSTWPSAWVG